MNLQASFTPRMDEVFLSLLILREAVTIREVLKGRPGENDLDTRQYFAEKRGTKKPNEPSQLYCVITIAVVRSDAYGQTRKFLNGTNLYQRSKQKQRT